jgi:hypothetical protein
LLAQREAEQLGSCSTCYALFFASLLIFSPERLGGKKKAKKSGRQLFPPFSFFFSSGKKKNRSERLARGIAMRFFPFFLLLRQKRSESLAKKEGKRSQKRPKEAKQRLAFFFSESLGKKKRSEAKRRDARELSCLMFLLMFLRNKSLACPAAGLSLFYEVAGQLFPLVFLPLFLLFCFFASSLLRVAKKKKKAGT